MVRTAASHAANLGSTPGISNMKKCESCKKEHDGSYASGRFCSRSCANSRTNNREEINRKISQKLKTKTSWYIDGRSYLRNKCKNCSKEISVRNKSGYCKKCLHKSGEYRELISKSLKARDDVGGYREGCVRNQNYYYDDIHFDSRKEIEVYIFLKEMKINCIRNNKRLYFIWENRKTYYIPDFYLPDFDIYVEFKGYWYNRKKRTLFAVKSNNIKWVLIEQHDWDIDKNILLEKINSCPVV